MGVFTGILLHGVGASFAALCFTPQKKVVQWAWQTYWLAQAFFCWLLLPVVIAWITIPSLSQVIAEAPTAVLLRTFVLGMGYGIGGTAFGMAIRYVGYSLTYAISVGISCILGTLLPAIIEGKLGTLWAQPGSALVFGGIFLGALGIALCGVAGRSKEKELDAGKKEATEFSMAKGLPLCLLAGIFSAVYGFSINEGQPIADIAARYGAGQYQGNVIYIFSNSGAFLTTFLYCAWLHTRKKTWGQYKALAGSTLSFNFLMAFITGTLWYFQFFFYGLGHVRMGAYEFTSWAIHMILLVLLSALTGLAMKEWKGSGKGTMRKLFIALAVLLVSVLVLTYGNYLGASE